MRQGVPTVTRAIGGMALVCSQRSDCGYLRVAGNIAYKDNIRRCARSFQLMLVDVALRGVLIGS